MAEHVHYGPCKSNQVRCCKATLVRTLLQRYQHFPLRCLSLIDMAVNNTKLAHLLTKLPINWSFHLCNLLAHSNRQDYCAERSQSVSTLLFISNMFCYHCPILTLFNNQFHSKLKSLPHVVFLLRLLHVYIYAIVLMILNPFKFTLLEMNKE